MGKGLVISFLKGWVPEYLKAPMILCCVLSCFWITNRVQHEGGLVAVTILGLTIANHGMESFDEMRRFKEYMTVLLVSSVFILLTAGLKTEFFSMLQWQDFAFVGAVLFVVRPLAIWTVTTGTQLNWREKLLLGWIAPRGIVAVAVTGLMSQELMHNGFHEAARLVPLAFLIVFSTVICHGLSLGKLSRWLNLASSLERNGVLIVGAYPWSTQFCEVLFQLGTPVLIADRNFNRLREARLAGIPVYYGEVLSEEFEFQLDMNHYDFLLAISSNDFYNSLVCSQFWHEFGRNRTFQLFNSKHDEQEFRSMSQSVRGRRFLHTGFGFNDMSVHFFNGWRFSSVRLTEQYSLEDWKAQREGDAVPIAYLDSSRHLHFNAHGIVFEPVAGDILIFFGIPSREGQAVCKVDYDLV
jgi:hypothetical protein